MTPSLFEEMIERSAVMQLALERNVATTQDPAAVLHFTKASRMDTYKPLTGAQSFSVEAVTRLQDAFKWHEHNERTSTLLGAALDAMCAEAQFRGMSPDEVVVEMKRTWEQATRPAGITFEDWTRFYYSAVGQCLSQYYGHQIED